TGPAMLEHASTTLMPLIGMMEQPLLFDSTRQRTMLCGREYVNGAPFYQILHLRLVLQHVRRFRMCLQMRGRFPFLDDDKRVVAVRRQRAEPRRVDESGVFDATVLGMHGRNVCLERLKHGVAMARLGENFYDHLYHFSASPPAVALGRSVFR